MLNLDAKNQLLKLILFILHHAMPNAKNYHQKHRLFQQLADEFINVLLIYYFRHPSKVNENEVFCLLAHNVS
jgi:hypothetical protein